MPSQLQNTVSVAKIKTFGVWIWETLDEACHSCQFVLSDETKERILNWASFSRRCTFNVRLYIENTNTTFAACDSRILRERAVVFF